MENSNILSVIIPCYNNGTLLKEMIDCFHHQTSNAWELIIVDDLSTDDTPDITKEYIRKDSNIRFFSRNRLPKGSVTCRNIGFEKSTGRYIAHLDADDLISNTFVEKRITFMEQNQDVDFASFPAKAFCDSTQLPTLGTPGKAWGVGNNNEDLLSRFLKADYPFSVWNNIYRRQSILDFPWDENVKIYTDFSFIIPTLLKGLKHKFSQLQEVDYYYRIANNSGNMCSNFVSQEKCDSTIYLFLKVITELKKMGVFKYYRKDFFQFIMLHFERLIMSDNRLNIKTFINCIAEHYPIKNRLYIISKVALIVPKKKIRKGILYLLCALLLRDGAYLKKILNYI